VVFNLGKNITIFYFATNYVDAYIVSAEVILLVLRLLFMLLSSAIQSDRSKDFLNLSSHS